MPVRLARIGGQSRHDQGVAILISPSSRCATLMTVEPIMAMRNEFDSGVRVVRGLAPKNKVRPDRDAVIEKARERRAPQQ